MNLAILIPTYDNLEGLKTLVEQIYKYTQDFKLYVIEDGQKEETINWMKTQPFTSIFHEINKVAKQDMAKFKQICGDNWQKLRKKYPRLRFQA